MSAAAPAPSREPESAAVRGLLGAYPDPRPRGPLGRLLRRIARELLWVVIIIMDAGRRFGSIMLRSEYRLAGTCHQRGVCCQHVLLEWSPWFERIPILGRMVLWKLTRVHSFFDRGYSWEVQDGLMTRVLGCHNLGADGRCMQYRLRPLICRTYPYIPLIGRPPLMPGCGFRFERRDGQPDPFEEPEPLIQIGGLRNRP